MRYGLGLNVNETVQDAVAKSLEAERSGIDYVWVSDVPEQRYAPAVASAIAASTRKIKIGLGLLSPFLHTPDQIASSIVTLNEAYGQRFELCIGPGDRGQLERVGVSLLRVKDIGDSLVRARDRIESLLRKNGVDCRIWIGAQGPRTLGVSGSFDGVLLNYAHPSMVKWAVEKVCPERTQGFQLGVYALSYVYRDFDSKVYDSLRVAGALVALGASKAIQRKLDIYEIVVQSSRRLKAGQSLESVIKTIPKEIIQLFSIFKSENELKTYLGELSRLRIEHLVFGYPQNHSIKTVRELAHALQHV